MDPSNSESESSDEEQFYWYGYYSMSDSDVDDDGGSLYDSEDFLFSEGLLPHEKNRTRKMLWEGNLPATDDAQVVSVAAVPADRREIIHLDGHLWATLPEEILFMILVRLPWTAQFRFRCVCSKWNHVLSSCAVFLEDNPRTCRSSCTVRSESHLKGRMIAFCHAENKWFDFRHSVLKPLVNAWDCMPKASDSEAEADSETEADPEAASLVNDRLNDSPYSEWVLTDVDGEHFCYHIHKFSFHWIAVCNPMIPESTLLLPPIFWGSEQVLFTRLLVDREIKAFKVVVLTLNETAIFDSVSVEWAFSKSFPDVHNVPSKGFVWKGDLYVYDNYIFLYVLDTISGTWGEVAKELPGEFGKKYCMVSSKDQVMLVQVDLSKDEFIEIWKMLNDAPGSVKPFSISTWVKQTITLPSVLKTLALDFRECTSHGSKYICFNGGLTYHWVKYNFSARQWIVMPWRGEREVIPDLHWFDWEPGLEMNFKTLLPWQYRSESSLP